MNNPEQFLLDNAAGPAAFRVTRAPALLAVSGSGTLKSHDGNGWDTGEVFTGTRTILAPGYYQVTLDVAGYAKLTESLR